MSVVTIVISDVAGKVATIQSNYITITASKTYTYVAPEEPAPTQECYDKYTALIDEIKCCIADTSCDVTNYNAVGRNTKKLQKKLLSLQNMLFILSNINCDITCEQIESLLCRVRSLKG